MSLSVPSSIYSAPDLPEGLSSMTVTAGPGNAGNCVRKDRNSSAFSDCNAVCPDSLVFEDASGGRGGSSVASATREVALFAAADLVTALSGYAGGPPILPLDGNRSDRHL